MTYVNLPSATRCKSFALSRLSRMRSGIQLGHLGAVSQNLVNIFKVTLLQELALDYLQLQPGLFKNFDPAKLV